LDRSDHLPEISGTVTSSRHKHGEADGFLLTDGSEVHVPRIYLPDFARCALAVSVKVRGSPRVFRGCAVAIDTPKGRILDEGPHIREDDSEFEKANHGPMTRRVPSSSRSMGRRVKPRGAVLEDGASSLPPHEPSVLADLLRKAQKSQSMADGATTTFGTVVEACESAHPSKRCSGRRRSPSMNRVRKGPKHRGKKHGPKHDPDNRNEEHAA